MLGLRHALPSISLLVIAGCGGGEAVPPPEAPTALAVTPAAAPAPKAAEPTCKEALAKSHPRFDALCKPACEAGDGDICFALADHHAAQESPDAKKVRGYLDEACNHGHDDSCFRVFQLLESENPSLALASLERACHEEPKTDVSKRSCRTLGEKRAEGGKVEEMRVAIALFERSCKAGDSASCSAKRRTERALDAKTAPTPEEGRIVTKTGNTVRIKLSSKSSAAVGADVHLERHFEAKSGQRSPLGALGSIFGSFQGWVGVAKARVAKVDGDVVTLTIVSEESVIKMNGKKVNHFTPKARVRFVAKKAAD